MIRDFFKAVDKRRHAVDLLVADINFDAQLARNKEQSDLEYPIIRYSDFCEIVYSSRTLLSEAHIGAADNRVYIRARTNIDEHKCTCIFGCVFSLSV